MERLTNLPSLRTNTPKLPADTFITRVESVRSDDEDDLSVEEFHLEQIGLSQEQLGYIAQYIFYENPDVALKTIYSAVGAAIKRYSFQSVLLAAKNLNNAEDCTLFPRLMYAAKAYHRTEKSRLDIPTLVETFKKREDSSRLRSMLKTPQDTLFSLLLDGLVTKEQYEAAKDSDEKCKALIREVVVDDTGRTT